MVRVSQYKLSKNFEDKILNRFFGLFSYFNKDQIKDILQDILTPNEVIMIAKRLAIICLLSRKKTFKEIGDILKVSESTIVTISNNFKIKGRGYKLIIDKFGNDWGSISDGKVYDKISNILKAKTNMKKRASLYH